MQCSVVEKLSARYMRESDKRRVGWRRMWVGRVERWVVKYRNATLSSMAGLERLRACALLAYSSPCERPCGEG